MQRVALSHSCIIWRGFSRRKSFNVVVSRSSSIYLSRTPREGASCYALLRMRPLSIPCVEWSVVISCGKVDYDKSG
jgi:hypothetical protein